jgi:hypothetical protein
VKHKPSEKNTPSRQDMVGLYVSAASGDIRPKSIPEHSRKSGGSRLCADATTVGPPAR